MTPPERATCVLTISWNCPDCLQEIRVAQSILTTRVFLPFQSNRICLNPKHRAQMTLSRKPLPAQGLNRCGMRCQQRSRFGTEPREERCQKHRMTRSSGNTRTRLCEDQSVKVSSWASAHLQISLNTFFSCASHTRTASSHSANSTTVIWRGFSDLSNGSERWTWRSSTREYL